MSRTRWSVWAAAGAMALGLFTGACASTHRAIATKAAPPSAAAAWPQDQGPVIQVRNRHWEDVNVYLLLGDTRYRLGTVGSTRVDRFSIARYAGWETHSLRVYVDPIGSTDTFTSDEFTLGTGQWADVVIEGTLSMSNYMVRNY